MIFFLLIPLSLSGPVDLSFCVSSCNSNGECIQYFEELEDSQVSYFLCECHPGFSGEKCDTCSTNRYGSLCEPCPVHNSRVCAGHGTCDSGLLGSGRCICEKGFSSQTSCAEEEQFLDKWPQVAAGTLVLILAAILCIVLIVFISKAPLLPRSAGSIVLGLCIGIFFTLFDTEKQFIETVLFKPEVFFLVLIPPIMFEAGFSLNKDDFFNNIGTILVFAVFGTVLTAFIFGISIYLLCKVFFVYQFSIIEALLFGALISATDPVATISINKMLQLNKNLTAVIFGESVLNDAVSIALFKVFSNFVMFKDLSYGEMASDFLMLFFGSISIGILFGFIITVILKVFRFPDLLDSSLFFLWVYIPYLLSEAIGMSGILAILFLGMIMGNLTIHSLSEKSKVTVEEYFKTFSFVAENFCFVYFGISMAMLHQGINFGVIIISIFSLLFSRAAVIFVLSPVCNLLRTHRLSYAERVMIWISGARGAIAFSLALSLPFRETRIYVITTQYLVLFTIVVLGIAAYPVARKLELGNIPDEKESPLFAKIKEVFEGKIKKWLVREKIS